MPWLGRQVAIAPGQVAVDGVALDALADDVDGFEAHALEFIDAFCANDLAELLDVLYDTMADAADQLPAVSPAGAPADSVRFQQDDAEAPLGQFDGRVEAGEPTADDADVGPLLALQRLEGQFAIDACGIVGGCMYGAVRRGCAVIHQGVMRGLHAPRVDRSEAAEQSRA